jgi:3-oxoacyl-[acyl-carrier protein] reductase
MDRNEVVLITGTGRGVGKYLAQHYSDNGFRVLGCSRGPVTWELKNYRHFYVDVSDEAAVLEMFTEIRRTYKHLDVLINNAGIMSKDYALMTNRKIVDDVFNINFTGTFLFCREASKLMMKKKYGRIVNISSIHVALSSVGTSIYGSSKAAVEQFSRVLAREVAPYGITVNNLGLGFVNNTGMVESLSENAVSEVLDRTMLKSRQELQDVAHSTDFLISEKSGAITGQTVYLGGVP